MIKPTTPANSNEVLSDAEVIELLHHLDPSMSYSEWIKTGMALHNGGYDFEVWDNWSSRGANYSGTKDCVTHWNSFGPGDISMGTLVHMAKEAGWRVSEPGWQSNRPTFEECLEAPGNLNEDSEASEIDAVLDMAERAKLKAIQHRQVMSAIKSGSKIPLGDLRRGFKEKQAENRTTEPEDLAHAIAKKMLRLHFANGDYLVRAEDRGFWQYMGEYWIGVSDENIQNVLLSVIDADTSVDPLLVSYNSVMKAALNLLFAMQAGQTDRLRLRDEPPSVINCQNGELWINDDNSVELRPHRHDSYLTYVLDVMHDPAATCFKFDQALIDIFANSSDPKDMARHFVEFIGYAIQPKRDIAAWFMLWGRGRNGKTKLIETVENLVSKAAVYSGRIGDFESSQFAIGALVGKLILKGDDVDTGTKITDGFLKSVSERKLLTGEHKFKDSFEFIATCLPVLLANNLPFTADLSLGIRRRAHIIPFDRAFTDEDADNKLFPYIWQNEMPGVLNRAVEGLLRLRARGTFQQPKDCLDAQKAWLASANPLTAFMAECCGEDPEGRVQLGIFYRAFGNWATECGIRNIPTRNTIKSNLEGLGYPVRHHEDGNAVHGIEIKRAWT